jgi:gas vesicle protein
MKKTVQIVTIPLDKEGWSKDELLKHIIKDTTQYSQVGDYKLINGGNCLNAKCWQAQQLLVLSDDEVKEEDWYTLIIADKGVVGRKLFKCHERPIDPDNATKVIASYPQIEGTLPISKETIQVWIDTGIPEEGTVDIVDWNCLHSDYCKCYNQRKFQPLCKYYKDSNGTKIDPQGNLLLEFGKKGYSSKKFKNIVDNTSPEIKERIKNWFDEQDIKAGKPSVPTDEEIKEKAQEYTRSINLGYIDTDLKGLEDIRTETTDAFEIGYKQALKDLVISKPDEYA